MFFKRRRNSNTTSKRSNLYVNNFIINCIILKKKILLNKHISKIVSEADIVVSILYPFLESNSKLKFDVKFLLFKVIFYAIVKYALMVRYRKPYRFLKRLQIIKLKLLKFINNRPKLQNALKFYYTSVLRLIEEKIKIILRFIN